MNDQGDQGGQGGGPSSDRGSHGTDDAVRRWRGLFDESVLLDGFHALKHALRFGAVVPVAVTGDKAAALGLASELAPDVLAELDALLVEVPAQVFGDLVPRVHPTGVSALAVRPERAAQLAALARTPRSAPVVVLDNPRNLGNAGAVIRLAAGFGATGVVTTGTIDPWHPNVVRGAAGLHFATAVERLGVAELPPGPVFALDPEGKDIRSSPCPTTRSSPSVRSAAASPTNCARVPMNWCPCRCGRRCRATTWRPAWG